MATSFAKASLATFVAPGGDVIDDTLLTDVTIETKQTPVPITQSAVLYAPIYDLALPEVTVTGLQIQPSIAVAEACTWSFGTNFKAADFTVQRQWELVDITGAGDTEKEFGWRMGVVSGQVKGWSTGDTDHLQVGGAMTLNLTTDIGTIARTVSGDNTVHWTQIQIGIPKRTGGPVPVSGQWLMSGPSTGDYEEFLGTTSTFDPATGNLSWTVTGGPTHGTVHAINNVISIHVPTQRGGPIEVTRQYKRSKS